MRTGAVLNRGKYLNFLQAASYLNSPKGTAAPVFLFGLVSMCPHFNSPSRTSRNRNRSQHPSRKLVLLFIPCAPLEININFQSVFVSTSWYSIYLQMIFCRLSCIGVEFIVVNIATSVLRPVSGFVGDLT